MSDIHAAEPSLPPTKTNMSSARTTANGHMWWVCTHILAQQMHKKMCRHVI